MSSNDARKRLEYRLGPKRWPRFEAMERYFTGFLGKKPTQQRMMTIIFDKASDGFEPLYVHERTEQLWLHLHVKNAAILSVDRRFELVTGWAPRYVIGKSLLDFITVNCHKAIEDMIDQRFDYDVIGQYIELIRANRQTTINGMIYARLLECGPNIIEQAAAVITIHNFKLG